MGIEIKTPQFPESVADGSIAAWHYKVGDQVQRDSLLVEIETEKIVLEVNALEDGVLTEILKQEGDEVLSEDIIAILEPSSVSVDSKPTPATSKKIESDGAIAPPPTAPVVTPQPVPESQDKRPQVRAQVAKTPSARKMAREHNIAVESIQGSGKGGRIVKEDVALAVALAVASGQERAPRKEQEQRQEHSTGKRAGLEQPFQDNIVGDRVERRVPMTRMRARIAERLVQAQHDAAMLTTFNEVNMRPVMDIRNKYKAEFEQTHDGIRLGFMSFFVRACVESLKRFPLVNATIDGKDILYHNYYDIGVAVSSGRGLVVPVLHNADVMSLAQIEGQIRKYAVAAQNNKLGIEDMTGGTFTISNGGVFGSLMSTPILNPPQTAILGMHKIQDRPIAVAGEVQIMPMMYLALSYDHRLIDGQEAVRFLVSIKDYLEQPMRVFLDL